MTVICIGYYDKFSRYFLDIKKHLDTQHNSTLNFKIYSIHLSGFLYNLFRLKFSSWIALKAWLIVLLKKRFYKTTIKTSDTYKGISYNDHIKFHLALNSKISKKALQLQALAYIDIFDTQFKKEQPDFLLTLGDSRLCIEIAIALAKQQNIKIYFIEQGPFNTTFFDNEGVNANLSIRKKFNSNTTNHTALQSKKLRTTTSKPYKRSPFYRGMDFLCAMLFERTAIYPPDLKHTDVIHRALKKPDNSLEDSRKATQPYVFLILQVPKDVNMIYHSPNFKTHTEIITSVYSNLPKDVKLIVREHPLYINKYDASMYEFAHKNNITIDNNTPLIDAINFAKIVVVNNSTVGIEAILVYKTVVVLGNAFYDNDQICLKLKTKEDLSSILEKAMYNVPDTVKIDTFKNALYNSVLLQGAITDDKLQSSKTIAQHLLETH